MPQSHPQPPSAPFEYRGQALDKWLENLPRASVGKTAEMLYKALQSIHMQSLKPAERFTCLEKLRETVSYVTGNMRSHFSGLAYPLPDKVMKIAAACQSINDYMSKGYRQVFHDLQKQNTLSLDRKMQIVTVHRAISSLNRCLLIAYEIYAAYHHDYWAQLHELYHYADIHQLSRQPVPDPELTLKKKSTVEDEYLRAVLLYMAEPYRLRPGEIRLADQHMEQWYELTSIQPVQHRQELQQTGLLVIELDQDQPPQYTGNSNVTSALEHCRIIDTHKLITQLKQELDRMIAELQGQHRPVIKNSVTVGLLQRLIESWGHSRRRRYPRQRQFDKVNVTIGLHNTHMQLMYEQFINNSETHQLFHNSFKKPKYESIEIKGVNAEQSDIWSTVYAWASSKSTEQTRPIPSDKDDILDYRVQQDNWSLLNASANGCALMSVEKQAYKLQVGELISIQRPGAATRELGIVRWLKAYSNTGVQIGVMLMAPSAIPVGLVIDKKQVSDQVVNRGLLLPLMTVLNRPESIITFSRHYKIDDVLQISEPGKDRYSIRLTKRIADNDTISQFLFVRIDHQLPLTNPDESSAEIDLKRYQDVWRII